MGTLSKGGGGPAGKDGRDAGGRVWKEDGVSEVSEGAGASGDRHAAGPADAPWTPPRR